MELFTLPEKLKTYPAQAVDVYACRMLPVDLDRTWNDAIKKMVASWIKTLSETHVASYFVGKVQNIYMYYLHYYIHSTYDCHTLSGLNNHLFSCLLRVVG